MKNFVSRVGLVMFFFAIGFSAVLSSSKRFWVSRDPAAIRQVYDFTHLRGSALDQALKERTIAGLEIFRDSGRVGFGLGHFAFMNAAGEKTLGCKEYSKVSFRFEAEGVVTSGEKPLMELEGDCQFSEDLAKINPLYIPVSRILGEKPADGEFQFREGQPVLVRFTNLSDEWPRKWALVGMKLTGHSEFNVDRNDLNQFLGRPFMIDLQ